MSHFIFYCQPFGLQVPRHHVSGGCILFRLDPCFKGDTVGDRVSRRGSTFLTDKGVKAQREPGKHFDGYGHGLYLRVGKPNVENMTGQARLKELKMPPKSWVVRCEVLGKRREHGIGSAYLVTLAEARERAAEIAKIARDGGDPFAEKHRVREERRAQDQRRKNMLTFEAAARQVFELRRAGWKSEVHADRWMRSLENDVFPQFGSTPISDVGKKDVLRVLAPIWTTKNDTAKRIKQRIAVVFAWAIDAGHHSGPNPTELSSETLPSFKREREHHDAMAWQDVPDFMADLSKREGISARCLEWLIHTTVRSGEARGARWSEIQGNVWVIPKERMKASKEHRVPLTMQALVVLRKVKGLDSDLLFPSPVKGKGGAARELDYNAFKALFIRMERAGFTTHGFRSSFRDWCGDAARADRVVAEAALAHVVGSKVEQAYARSDLFDRRRELMESWSVFIVDNVK